MKLKDIKVGISFDDNEKVILNLEIKFDTEQDMHMFLNDIKELYRKKVDSILK